MKIFKQTVNLDGLGITASTLCAIHCAALPFVFTLLPLWGLGFLANHTVEITMIAISLILGIWSLSKSYRKAHQSLVPIFILVSGFLMIAAGHFLATYALEPILVPLGGFTIATAHFINLKLVKNCPLNHKH